MSSELEKLRAENAELKKALADGRAPHNVELDEYTRKAITFIHRPTNCCRWCYAGAKTRTVDLNGFGYCRGCWPVVPKPICKTCSEPGTTQRRVVSDGYHEDRYGDTCKPAATEK